MFTAFNGGDANSDSFLDFDEFSQMFCEIYGFCGCTNIGDDMCNEQALSILDEFDSDEDDKISPTEFGYIHYFYCKNSYKTAEELYNEYDLDLDQKFNSEEFQTVFCTECNKEELPEC